MSGGERRAQVLALAAEEFASHGLHGASTEVIARRAEITQAYVFRIFGTKKALFLEVVKAAFGRVCDGMYAAADDETGLDALTRMGAQYYELLADRTGLLLQLQAFAACGDEEVREAVRGQMAQLWETVSGVSGLDPVTVKSFLAYGMLLNNAAALQISDLDEPWAVGLGTRIQPGLFAHITSETNQ